jgi:hypothetical protein
MADSQGTGTLLMVQSTWHAYAVRSSSNELRRTTLEKQIRTALDVVWKRIFSTSRRNPDAVFSCLGLLQCFRLEWSDWVVVW